MAALVLARARYLLHRLTESPPGFLAHKASIELTMSELALFLEGSEVVGRISLSPTEIKPIPLAQAYIT